MCKKIKVIKNTRELNVHVCESLTKLLNGEIGVKRAQTISNLSNTIIRNTVMEMKRQMITGSQLKIPFVDL